MSLVAPQITSLTIVYSAVCSDADQRKHQSSASLAFVWGIHRGPVNSPHKWPVTRKMFPFDDVIMGLVCECHHWFVNVIIVSGLATDSPCGVWGRGWTTCLLCGGPIIGKWQLLCKFDIVKGNFLLMFCFCYCLYTLTKFYLICFFSYDFTLKLSHIYNK